MCDITKYLRLMCGLNALELYLLIRSQNAEAVLRLMTIMRI